MTPCVREAASLSRTSLPFPPALPSLHLLRPLPLAVPPPASFLEGSVVQWLRAGPLGSAALGLNSSLRSWGRTWKPFRASVPHPRTGRTAPTSQGCFVVCNPVLGTSSKFPSPSSPAPVVVVWAVIRVAPQKPLAASTHPHGAPGLRAGVGEPSMKTLFSC